jgi:hypothetical protein
MITERAMLAAVHISIWTAVKHDRKVSRDVANQHGAHEGAGRYNKQLLRGAEKLDALRTLAGQIRQHFYKITLPWSDEGYRLLPAHFYFDLTTQMREFERSFSQSVEEFLEIYPSYIEQVRPELNGLFRKEDYPSTEKLRAKFGVKLEVLPIPSGDDFRVTLSEEEQARVAREIDESVRLSLNRGTKDLWVRLTDVLTHMVDKLNEPESRFHASFVTNVLDLVDLLPRLNVNHDEELNRFAAEIKDRLCNFSAHDLKKNEILRVATASHAAQILSQMDAVLRGREEDPANRTKSLRSRVRQGSRRSFRTCRRIWRLQRHDEAPYPRGPDTEGPDRAPSRSSFLRFVTLSSEWTGLEVDSDHGHGRRLLVLQSGFCRYAERGRARRRLGP